MPLLLSWTLDLNVKGPLGSYSKGGTLILQGPKCTFRHLKCNGVEAGTLLLGMSCRLAEFWDWKASVGRRHVKCTHKEESVSIVYVLDGLVSVGQFTEFKSGWS